MVAALCAVFAMAGQAAVANSMSGSTAMMPKCATGDRVVGVNTKTKMYMTMQQMQAKMAGMSPAQQHAMMTKNNVKMMCKTNADSLGAKIMNASAANPVSNAGH